jgi:hypothetical protein
MYVAHSDVTFLSRAHSTYQVIIIPILALPSEEGNFARLEHEVCLVRVIILVSNPVQTEKTTIDTQESSHASRHPSWQQPSKTPFPRPRDGDALATTSHALGTPKLRFSSHIPIFLSSKFSPINIAN